MTLSLNKCNSSELSNSAAISLFRSITWPTSVSRHDNTLKGGKIHCYNDIREIAKTPNSPTSSVNKPISQTVQVFSLTLHEKASYSLPASFLWGYACHDCCRSKYPCCVWSRETAESLLHTVYTDFQIRRRVSTIHFRGNSGFYQP